MPDTTDKTEARTDYAIHLMRMATFEATPERLAELAEQRAKAWKAFNPKAAPSAENDWCAFAAANTAWLNCYIRLHGSEPPWSDLIDDESSHWMREYKEKNKRGGKKAS